MLTRCELYENICDVALDQCNRAWKIERLDQMLADINEIYRAIEDNPPKSEEVDRHG